MTLDLDEMGRIASAALAAEKRNWLETTGAWEINPKDDEQVIVRGTYKKGDELIPDCFRSVTDGSISTDAAHIAAFDPPAALALLARARDAERAAVLLAEYRTLRSKGIFNLSDAEMTRMQVLPGLIADLLSTLNEGDE